MASTTDERIPQDVFRSETGSCKQKRTLVYFIPGNPGYVDFYRSFLDTLTRNFRATGRDDAVIYGANHDGFTFSPSLQSTPHGPPYNLTEVIAGKRRDLLHQIAKLRDTNPSPEPIQVILVGHSVGAYILLELAHTLQPPDHSYTIAAGISLFPTVVSIARSEKGRALTWLLTLPLISHLVQALAALLRLVPLWLWNWPAALTPGEKRRDHNAVTEALIRTPGHVRQLIYLAGDEMLSIKEDKWHPANFVDDETGRALSAAARTKLFFYWGERDYWVDNQVRDDYIAARKDVRAEDAPVMVIDDEGMDHCFSLTGAHERTVAEQVGAWIGQVMDGAASTNGLRKRNV